MVQVKADGATSAFLVPIKETTQVLNEDGKLLGMFVPAEDSHETLRQMAIADYRSGAYQERKAAAVASHERFTTEQVLERLRKLETA